MNKREQKEKDINFLRDAFKFASKYSQDANSQTGAVIVSPSGEIISKGANRAHYGMDERYEGSGERKILERPDKYEALTHAERDAVFCANREGRSLINSTLYATWTPCVECAEVILNNGIARFVTHESTHRWYTEARKDNGRNDWTAGIEKALKLFKKGNIVYEMIDDPIGDVEFLFDDKIRNL